MNAGSGHAITDINEHIACPILTPIGSRVMRRAYGSRLFNLIDQPVDNAITKPVRSPSTAPCTYGEPRDLFDQYHPERAGCRSVGCHYPANRTDNQTFNADITLRLHESGNDRFIAATALVVEVLNFEVILIEVKAVMLADSPERTGRVAARLELESV